MYVMKIKNKIQYWSDNLKLLSGTDRLEYLIELGRKLTPIEEKYKIDSFKIHGCASNLWLVPQFEKKKLTLLVDGDAFITKGTAYIVLDIMSGQSYSMIKQIKREDFSILGMQELLSVQRQNGLGLLIATIKRYAETK